ncbi:hypothetical protein G6F65_020607 [Rhizopus arrhizus]|nr:hypothetical protein G6F65_020607 [Rhizopus arrhizus]
MAAQGAHHGQFVRDDHDGHAQALVDVAQHGQHRPRGFGVERRGGFVAQQHGGLAGQGTRDRHALLLPARQLRRVAGGLVGQADDIQAVPHARGDLFTGAPAMHPQREGDVFKHGLVLQQVELLEDHADVLARAAQFALGQRG